MTGGIVFALTGSSSSSFGLLLGPFAGGFARDWQSCCAQNSFAIAPYAIGGLVLASGIQVRVRPEGKLRRALRVGAWWLAVVGWFLAGLISYAHALE